jgi:multiple antibiotic resistance protein
MDYSALIKSILILFAIVNPVGNIPILLHLTGKMPRESRRRAFQTAVLTSALILFLFILAGKWILTYFFQIQLHDLMSAGGLLLLIIAIDHLVFGALVKSVLVSDGHNAHSVGAVPMACPILAGPGAMMTVFVTFSEHGFLIASIAILAVVGVTFLLLRFIDTIYRFLGETVCLVLSKILSLFIAAIGIRLLMNGLAYYFTK